MRSQPPIADTSLMEKTLSVIPEKALVTGLSDAFASADDDTVSAILNEAAKFANEYLVPLNDVGDSIGATVVDGRVITPPEMKTAWEAMKEAGWLAMDVPEKFDGQGLPLFTTLCVQEIFDRSCPAASMLPTPNRSAAKLLDAFGRDELKTEWIPKLVSGEYAASICISEVGAGSDVNRIRTSASHITEDIWAITGEKQWISFGDQDLTENLGHCLLARAEGDKGLSLFFVPRLWEGEDNHIVLRRIEEKLGLHLSPTCALGFEGSKGWLLGKRERGLPQLFVMIANMRLFVGNQGLGIASGAADVALKYASERLQGGRGETPMPIIEHADVQRQLMEIIADVETLRALGLTLGCHIDIANHAPDESDRKKSSALASWLLPSFKTIGSEIAFDASSKAIQVLGGAGYTREWPVEQALRDARVFTVFEGTSGIQALDLLHRRLLGGDKGQGLEVFLDLAGKDANALGGKLGALALDCYDTVKLAAAELEGLKDTPRRAEASATTFLSLTGYAARVWSATRLAGLAGEDPASKRLRASGEYLITGAPGKARGFLEQMRAEQTSSDAMQQVTGFNCS
ncbi:MAG: acyl-CoA dehydrogenase [Ponticaulis sp.]|nr:acyl-CoA dehydrogenase [Ponticaulis sp.]